MDLGETNFALLTRQRKKEHLKRYLCLWSLLSISTLIKNEWMTSKKERKTINQGQINFKRLSLNSAEWTRWLNSKKLNKKEERKEKNKVKL